MLKRFRNGNIHVKLDRWDCKGESGLLSLYNNYDLVPVGDEFYLSNYESAMYWTNGTSEYFQINNRELNDFQNGKSLILSPITDEFTIELIREMEEI